MKLNLNAAWEGAMRLISGNREMLAVLVGVFFLLPGLATGMFLPHEDTILAGIDRSNTDAMMQAMSAFYMEYWWVFVVLGLVQSVGAIAVMAVMADPVRPTVGESIARGVRMLPTMIVANLLVGLGLGLIFGILITLGSLAGPAGATLATLFAVGVAMFLFVRFSLVSPAIALHAIANPLTALGTSWKLTKSNGLRLFCFYALLLIAFLVLSAVAGLVVGLPLALAGENIALIGDTIVGSIITAAFALIAYAVLASVYLILSRTSGDRSLSVPPSGKD